MLRSIQGAAFLLLALTGLAQAAEDFVVFGKEGVWLGDDSTVVSGDVGANVASSGPFFADTGVEVIIGKNVVVQDSESRVLGDSVKVDIGAQVHDVH